MFVINLYFISDLSRVIVMIGVVGKIEILYFVKDILVVCWYCLYVEVMNDVEFS